MFKAQRAGLVLIFLYSCFHYKKNSSLDPRSPYFNFSLMENCIEFGNTNVFNFFKYIERQYFRF